MSDAVVLNHHMHHHTGVPFLTYIASFTNIYVAYNTLHFAGFEFEKRCWHIDPPPHSPVQLEPVGRFVGSSTKQKIPTLLDVSS